MPKLLIQSGDHKGSVYILTDKKLTIGRDPTNVLVLSDRRISRNHAVIFLDGNGYTIEDLGSVNGVYVNNALVTKARLSEGDEIRIGTTRLSFLALDASEEIDATKIPAQVQIIPDDQIPHGLTLEVRIPLEEPKSLETEFEKVDPAALKNAYKRLMTIYHISHDLGSVVELQKLLDRILDLVLETLQADRGFIMLIDPLTGEFRPPVVKNRKGLESEIKISKTLIKHVIKTQEAVLTSDALEDQRFKEAQSIIYQGIRSAMCVPLKCKEKLLGIMHIDTQVKEIRFTKPDLELLTAIASQAAIAIENAAMFEDIKQANREIKERQAQLIEAEKLSALGRMAGGVAHEINNPMTCILGFSGMVKEKLARGNLTPEETKDCAESMRIVEEEAHHCARIAQTLLQFGRRKKAEMALTDVNAVIKETLMIAKFHIKRVSIKIQDILDPQLPQIPANAGQLQQVFLNFIINARDAMETTGGSLTVSTAKAGNNQIEIKFADTGCGIPQDKLEEIFKPLYTTKGEGKGTGLGLSISQEIIELHRGTIDVESIVGQGTTFTIRLPINS